MPRNKKITPNKKKNTNLEKEVMNKITSGQVSMKPRWYFVLGTALSVIGLAALSVASIFLTNLIMFWIRRRGPMAGWRLQMMLENFPVWIPILAIGGIVGGVWLLKKYDFSYKKNFYGIVVGFIAAIIIAGLAIDILGLNDLWSRKGMMRRFYQNIDVPVERPYGPGRGMYYTR